MDDRSLAAARIRRFLETEPVVWLSSVTSDGAPHLVPTWFAWDGEAIVIVSKPGAVKVRNLRAEPRAMLAFGDAEDDFDVGLLEARAELLTDATPSTLPAGFAAKYADRIEGLGLTQAQFAWTYSQQIRLTPLRALGWHGRTPRASVVTAAGQVAAMSPTTLTEPGRGLTQWLGEPLARGLSGLGAGLRRPGLAI